MKVPLWGWFAGAVSVGVLNGSYQLGDSISRWIGASAFVPKIPFLDDKIPLIPAFVIIYILSFAFWIFGPIFTSVTKRENYVNCTIGWGISVLIGFLTFSLLPTYVNREAEGALEAASQTGIIPWMLRFIYQNDGGEIGRCLCPSFHCLQSVCCYLSVRKQPEVPKAYRIFALGMTVLICLSTVFTKQHYVIDVFFGVTIPIVSTALAKKYNWAQVVLKGEKHGDVGRI